ncbi:AAA family ATPase [Propionivibrio limicola]|uniref:bifunctional aminoglycoside phosphotransferase/ATP-binding protein n=1 Tax=Propionivibrio limicola TaxID=167645 RepID=UPI0012924817|nr:bifunctional aminoglycoside phosphotransferase/ATP-binding protein [Propionivibrio limicola]
MRTINLPTAPPPDATSPETNARAQQLLVRSWPQTDSSVFRHRIRVVETHISYVLLNGRFAYKIKKPVNLGFLDFSSLDKRRLCCEEELRLNRRLAPELYLAVVPITGTPQAPCLAGEGAAIEYAVKMRRFPQSSLLDRRLAHNAVPAELIDALADRIAAFHAQAPRCPASAAYGSPSVVWEAMAENLRQLRHALPAENCAGGLDRLERWSHASWCALDGIIVSRQHVGMVRECHGDLHLGNIALMRGKPLIFDCIEFNPNLRWIDVINEVAFMVMDLEERGRADYAHRFLNRYLEQTGDYAGLPLLAFYQVYRALVRAKVAAIRAGQEEGGGQQHELAVCGQYLDYAQRATAPPMRQLTLLHGFSGSGKSWVSQILLEATGAIRLRSDVERKRLASLPLRADSRATGRNIYGAEMTSATYARLSELSRQVLMAGYPVVVDAASLKAWQRELFRTLAEQLSVPFRLLACQAPEELLQQRLAARAVAGSDVSEADTTVLMQQMNALDPLSETEKTDCLVIDTEHCTPAEVLQAVRRSADFNAP